jgi:cell wall-associated NlpC family hydrolase
MHWSADYIGTPWVAGLSDCWSFARRVWRQEFGWQVPAWEGDPANLRAGMMALSGDRPGWVPVAEATEGDAVLMGRSSRPCHVGVWITPPDGAGVLHALEQVGVVYTPPARLCGLRILGLYRRQA